MNIDHVRKRFKLIGLMRQALRGEVALPLRIWVELALLEPDIPGGGTLLRVEPKKKRGRYLIGVEGEAAVMVRYERNGTIEVVAEKRW